MRAGTVSCEGEEAGVWLMRLCVCLRAHKKISRFSCDTMGDKQVINMVMRCKD